MLRTAGLTLVLAVVGAAHAQIQAPPTGFGYRQGVPLRLILGEAVQVDLGLSAESAHQLIQIYESIGTETKVEMQKQSREGSQSSRETRRKVEESYQSKLNELLNPEQQSRLQQILLQGAKLSALSDAAVAKELGLSADQENRILAAHREYARHEKGAVKSRMAVQQKLQEFSAARDKTLLAVLSAEQQAAFELLKGKPFDGTGGRPKLTRDGRDIEACCVAFSPDGKRLASTRDDQIIVWDATSGERLLTLKGHTSQVTGVVFSPDGTRLASSSADLTVKLWDATSGLDVLTLKPHDQGVRSVVFSRDGTQLTSASGNQTRTSDAVSGTEKSRHVGGVGLIWSLAASPDGQRVALASADGLVYVRHPRGATVRLKGHTGAVFSVAFHVDKLRLASAGEDGTVRVWDAIRGQPMLTLTGHMRPVRSVAWSPDGQWLASASEDKTAKLWDASSGQTVFTWSHAEQVTGVAFSPDGKSVASASIDHTVRVWNAASGQETLTLMGAPAAGQDPR